jgi:hypothetical protein
MSLSSFSEVQAWRMPEPAISACHSAGSTYGTLAASKPGSKRSPAAADARQALDVVVNPLSALFRSSESRRSAFCSGLPSVFRTSGCPHPTALTCPV